MALIGAVEAFEEAVEGVCELMHWKALPGAKKGRAHHRQAATGNGTRAVVSAPLSADLHYALSKLDEANSADRRLYSSFCRDSAASCPLQEVLPSAASLDGRARHNCKNYTRPELRLMMDRLRASTA